MTLNEFHSKVSELYVDYRTKVHPLVVVIQIESGEFPTQILNEIRSFDFHIACCYSDIENDVLVNKHISKAKSHIERGLIDCYKSLVNIIYFDKVRDFENNIKKHIYSVEKIIDNGNFYRQYTKLKDEIEEKVKLAQMSEVELNSKQNTIKLFQESYNSYIQLNKLINENNSGIMELVNSLDKKITKDKVIKYSGWIASIISLICGFLMYFKLL